MTLSKASQNVMPLNVIRDNETVLFENIVQYYNFNQKRIHLADSFTLCVESVHLIDKNEKFYVQKCYFSYKNYF